MLQRAPELRRFAGVDRQRERLGAPQDLPRGMDVVREMLGFGPAAQQERQAQAVAGFVEQRLSQSEAVARLAEAPESRAQQS